MHQHDLIRSLREPATSKILLVVADGLGGLPLEPGGKTELESAQTPNLDEAARDGVCGLSIPVLPGITPGSGPGHLSLFGYDPLEHLIGRGVLEALGINFPVGPKDIAIRGNFVTVDKAGKITDRRAGRPETERCIAMCKKLAKIQVSGVKLFVEPVREHRFVLVIRGEGLGDALNDTDPQEVGVKPLEANGADQASKNTAKIVNQFAAEAAKVLRNDSPTNMVTLRGFAKYPAISSMQDIYGLRCCAVAVYPMYRGLARLVGMTIVECGATLAEQVDALKRHWDQFDFFFLHYKYTDSTGEDGNFPAKVKAIEQLDAEISRMRALGPDVFVVTGDHSTPSKLKSHSWHPVPTLLFSQFCRTDAVTAFSEAACIFGGLGFFQAKHLMLMAMAHAGRLSKFGA
jgi:2,3-bisphosphoglycerate-independent phosphoglycerate mutase